MPEGMLASIFSITNMVLDALNLTVPIVIGSNLVKHPPWYLR